MLEAHGQTQQKLLEAEQARRKELELYIRETVAKLETRKQADATSPRGGHSFEEDVLRFVQDATRGGTYLVHATGNTTGSLSRCKKGDAVIEFTPDSAFEGCRVVLEAKRDGSYSVPKALEEMEEARKNRDATVGVFIFATSHAPVGFSGFERYGNTILVSWDPEQPETDPILRGALLASLAMASRRHNDADPGDLQALRDVEKRISEELKRIAKMRTANERISKSSDEIRDELRKAEKKFEQLLDRAKDTLRALQVELVDEGAEKGSPIGLPPHTPAPVPVSHEDRQPGPTTDS